jgi:23S rRNA (guanine745-N1)-methyltransferase
MDSSPDYIYKCPVCGKSLAKAENIFACKDRHTFDISKEGYVNLLLASRKNSKSPGDSREMIAARHQFLNRGYFKKLSDELNRMAICRIKDDRPKDVNILDAGCGEGYYLDALCRSSAGRSGLRFYGVDISKEGAKTAARRNNTIHFAVANSVDIPVMNASVQVLLSMFTPFAEQEFARVLADDGFLFLVNPGARHLWELKKSLYEMPYLNKENKTDITRFKSVGRSRIAYDIEITGPEDLRCLIAMTPYYWKTDAARIKELIGRTSTLSTSVEFIVDVLRK